MNDRAFYVKRWLLTYLTRYPRSTWRQIAGATSEDKEIVATSLFELTRTGYAKRTGDRFSAAEPWGMYIARER